MSDPLHLDALWQRAIPLPQAINRVGTQRFGQTWADAKAGASTNSMLLRFAQSIEAARSQGDAVQAAVQKASNVNAEATKPFFDMQHDVQEHLRKGLLLGAYLGLGFENPRRLSDTPRRIPADLWHGHIRWDISRLDAQSIRLIEIRILSRATAEGPQPVAQAPAPRSAGRPSLKAALNWAFDQVDAEKKVNPEASFVAHIPLFRQALESYPGDLSKPASAISNEAYRKHLSSRFKSLKKAHKQ